MNNNRNLILYFLFATVFPACLYGSSTETYTYNALGHIATKDGPRIDVNDIVEYQYYANGDLRIVTDPLGHTTHYHDYDVHGNPGRIVNPNGVETHMLYDVMGRLVSKKIINPENSNDVNETSYSYDETGLITEIVLPDGNELSYQYDGFLRLAAITNSNEERIEYLRDSAGNISSQALKSPNGQVKFQAAYVYDELRQLRSVINASDDTIAHEYDLLGNVVSTSDGRNHTTVKIYDELDRLTKLIDPALHETEIEYDSNDNISSVLDANGNSTTYTYDVFGNILSQSSPDTGVTTHQYDSAHNRIQTTDSRGVVSEYEYDALNRLIAARYPAAPGENVIYNYDDTSNGNYGIGYLTSITTSNDSIEYKYNFLGLVTEKRTTLNGHVSVVNYDFDIAGQLIKITYPTGRQVSYEYDTSGKIEQVYTRKDSASLEIPVVSGLAYLPFGPVKQFTFGNGLSHALDYDQNYRLNRINVGSANPILDRQYQYDGASNIAMIVNGIDISKSQEFAYDSVDRLIQADGQYGLVDYVYDPVGNRLSRGTQSNGVDIVEEYIYENDSNRLLYVDESTNGIPSQSRAFSYDAAGNRIEGHGEDGSNHGYQYNAANRLANVSVDEDPAVSYIYNPLGQRIQKIKADGSEERYHYNESGQLLSVTDENGATLREYIYRGTQQVALIARASGETPDNPNPPTEPSPVLILDEAAATVEGNHVIATNHAGWTGEGFIDYVGEGQVNWSIIVPIESTYNIHIHYSLASGNRPLKLLVNGEERAVVDFPGTGSFAYWKTSLATVTLPAGSHTLSLATNGLSGPNIDKLELSQIVASEPRVLDESNIGAQGNHLLATNHDGYTGSGFIDVVGEGQLDWPLNIVTDTEFNVKIRYALGAGPRPMVVLLNNVEVGYAGFVSTGTFTSWNYANLAITVPAGNHTLSLQTIGSSGPNIDKVELIATTSTTSPPDPTTPSDLALYYIHSDHLDTPQVITNAQQQVVWMADYLPFGQVMPNGGNAVELFSRFPGQYLDEETGLHYNYFRDYDPSIGRYIESDPIGLEGGLNTYTYVLNNPLKSTDPLGLWSISVDAYAGLGGGITIGYNESTDSWFGGGRVGIGAGIGANLDVLDGGPKDDPCSGSGGTKLGTFGSLSANAGPIGGAYEFEGGRYTGGGDFSKEPSLKGVANGLGGKGVSVGGAIGVQAIGY